MALFQHRDQALRLLVAAGACGLAVFGQLLFHGREIGERELRVDGLDVRERIDLARDMNDVGILEAAHDVRDGVGLANVREKLVAQAFALARARDQSGDVDEFHGGGNDFLRLRDGG